MVSSKNPKSVEMIIFIFIVPPQIRQTAEWMYIFSQNKIINAVGSIYRHKMSSVNGDYTVKQSCNSQYPKSNTH